MPTPTPTPEMERVAYVISRALESLAPDQRNEMIAICARSWIREIVQRRDIAPAFAAALDAMGVVIFAINQEGTHLEMTCHDQRPDVVHQMTEQIYQAASKAIT